MRTFRRESVLFIDSASHFSLGEIVSETTGCPLRPGDRVRLNDRGFDVLPRLSRTQMNAAVGILVVKDIGHQLEEDSWGIDIEGPLERFIFTNKCFDKV